MAQCGKLAVAALALILLLLSPALAWYKPAAGPHHYSVGCASGLPSSFHRFPSTRRSLSEQDPYAWRCDALQPKEPCDLHCPLRPCVSKTPNLQSCQWQFNRPGTFQSLSLREAECQWPEP
ncbi:Npb [Phodopus roborovskii]|uniref:Npb protein n=1 Tax=Phodopus roborovskii TaxID=109678 RepID=A0AAU9YP23_PHORO|nr:Npb [Phodopus roborovskii]